jgi:hypothetical protein
MALEEYEKLPPEEKEHFAVCAKCGETSIAAAWTKFCFTPPTIRTGRTFSIQARKSWIRHYRHLTLGLSTCNAG